MHNCTTYELHGKMLDSYMFVSFEPKLTACWRWACQGLSALTGLRRLGVSGTVAGGDALLSLAATLPALRHLEMRNAQLSDANLLGLPTVRPRGCVGPGKNVSRDIELNLKILP